MSDCTITPRKVIASNTYVNQVSLEEFTVAYGRVGTMFFVDCDEEGWTTTHFTTEYEASRHFGHVLDLLIPENQPCHLVATLCRES